MPVQTRKKPAAHPKQKDVYSPKGQQKDNKRKAGHDEHPNKKQKEHPEEFDAVVDEIDSLGKGVTRVLHPPKKTKAEKHQNEEKRKQRALVNSEIRRWSQTLEGNEEEDEGNWLKPKVVKEAVKKESKKHEGKVKKVKETLVKEIEDYGPKKIHTVLKKKEHKKRNTKPAVIHTKKQKHEKEQQHEETDDMDVDAPQGKDVKKETLDEILKLVSPKSQYKPSNIKNKVERKKVEQLEETGEKKEEVVKEIKGMGEKGVKKVLKKKK